MIPFLIMFTMFSEPLESGNFELLRLNMVANQLKNRGIINIPVLNAMSKVPRHLFVPKKEIDQAYDDCPLPIGFDQTISQPYIVALMTEMLDPESGQKILEIGTGSGYQAAILAEIVESVYSIEIICPLLEVADSTLKSLGYSNIYTRCGDGYDGWSEHAPFDGIIVTAAPEKVPQPLLDQLKEGGRLIVPVGDRFQYLEIYTKKNGKIYRERDIAVRFVPMTGKAEEEKEK